MKRKLNILLVLQSGGDYSITDVILLARKLVENTTMEISVNCLCDSTNKVQMLHNVKLIPMTCKAWKGWWSKMNMFSPRLINFRPFLYIDLDTAIIGNIDFLVKKVKNDLVTLSDFYRPRQIGSAVMWIPANNKLIDRIWNRWISEPEKWMKKFRGDQDFLFNCCEGSTVKFWQDLTDKISSFKPEPSRLWLKELPKNISVVCFHGKPRIGQAVESIEWVKNYCNE